jgi:excisionase family DNA binding protein
MSILSPSDRAVLWRTVTTSGPDDRGPLLRVLAREVLDSIGSRLNMYAGYEDDVVTTIALLDQAGLLGRDDLREAFEEAGEDDEQAEAMAALLAAHLGQAADIERLGVDMRLTALRLATAWQQHVTEHASAKPEWLTAAQVAARYGVTPQAVYKWIRAGRVQAEQTPGGSWRLPVSQFGRGSRVDPERITALKSKLLSIGGDTAISDEDLAEEIVDRRQS